MKPRFRHSPICPKTFVLRALEQPIPRSCVARSSLAQNRRSCLQAGSAGLLSRPCWKGRFGRRLIQILKGAFGNPDDRGSYQMIRGGCQSGRMIRLMLAEGNLPCSTLHSMLLIEKSPCSRMLRTSVGVMNSFNAEDRQVADLLSCSTWEGT